jgi:octaprenyl-diphosphate synthase
VEHLTGSGQAFFARVDPRPTREAIGVLVAERLRAVERMFRANLASPLHLVDEVGEFVADGGGKRIRPTVHLLCARMCGYDGPHDVVLATVVELIHGATLIHDDILDEATTRRGRPSVNSRFGNSVTVLFGDYMFAKAMELALVAKSLAVMERLTDVTLRMTEGEMLQTRYVGRIDLDVRDYLDLIDRKTAALFACACELAGVIAGADAERRRALADYGRHLGTAFQLVDDLLDLVGDEATLGKPAGRDLREGKATLAVLELVASGSPRAGEDARRAMAGGRGAGAALARLHAALRDGGALDRVRERARFHARLAVGELARFDDGPARRALESLPGLLLDRDR